MKIISSPHRMQSLALQWRRRGKNVGLVPTMGALHQGHLSLFRKARKDNDVLVASIFVNPSQFGPKEDFARYPRPWQQDRRLAALVGVDILFAPSAKAMYPEGYQTWISVEHLSKPLCGGLRPGHFVGVATVVAKLFNLIQPTRAYFGRKDFQQFRILERLAADLNLPVELVPCPTVRESDGLAVSSRNAYLDPAERRAAAEIHHALQAVAELIKFRSSVDSTVALRVAKSVMQAVPQAKVEYLEVVDPVNLQRLKRVRQHALIAAALRIGRTRLIDNVLVGPLKKIA